MTSAESPGRLLDAQRSLYEWLASPPPAAVDIFDQLFRAMEAYSEDPAAPKFVRRSFATLFHPATDARALFELVRRPLFAAPAYQVTAEIVTAVNGMYRRTLEETEISLCEADLPSPSGYMNLDEPIVLTDAAGASAAVRLITWGPQSLEEEGLVLPGMRITTWCLASDLNVVRYGPTWTYPMVMQHSQVVPYGRLMAKYRWEVNVEDLGLKASAGAGPDDFLLWAYILWMFMGTEIVAQEKPDGIRPFERRARRAGSNPAVRVIQLRRMRQGTHEVGHREVDWTCRWVVQEFWRHLESYASQAESHQAKVTGAEKVCAVCGIRVTHVRAHVRGPEGLPLKAVPETVYRVSR